MTENATLAEIRAQAVDLMTQHELYGWSFAFDQRKQRAGSATVPRDGRPGMITVSAPLLSLWTPAQRRETILHEIAHVLTTRRYGPGHHHDTTWQAVAREIGADPRRTTGHDGQVMIPRTAPAITGTCPNGHEHKRYKMPHGRDPRRSCPQCSDRFNTRYLITWRRTP